MTPKTQPIPTEPISQDEFQQLLHDQIRQAVRLTLVAILDAEVEAFIGAGPYERRPWRRDRRKGYYTRDLDTSVGHLEGLSVPRTRGGFRTQVFERYRHRRAELDESIGEMFIRSVSMRQVGPVLETLTGTAPSASTVSRVFHTPEEEYQAWKNRPLAEGYLYAFADPHLPMLGRCGTYFTVMYEAAGHKMPILTVRGVKGDGDQELLAFTIGDRENQTAWEGLFEELRQRGVQQVGLWVTDGHQATPAPPPSACAERLGRKVLQIALAQYPHHQHHRAALRRAEVKRRSHRLRPLGARWPPPSAMKTVVC